MTKTLVLISLLALSQASGTNYHKERFDNENGIDESNLGRVMDAKPSSQRTLHDLVPMEEEKQESNKDNTIVESGTLVSSTEDYSAFR
jgi:hypothetical protein